MTIDEKAMWNKKYSEKSHGSLEPDPFLVSAYEEFVEVKQPSDALDVAGGVGRHSIWLARRGWNIRLLDISEVGINLARENAARELGPSAKDSAVTADVVDLNAIKDLGRERYDLILVFFYLQRELFPALISALKPRGHLIYKTYTVEQQRLGGGSGRFKSGPSHPMFLLQPNELLRAFKSLRILHYHETVAEKGVAELVARK